MVLIFGAAYSGHPAREASEMIDPDYVEWDGHPNVPVPDDELRRLIAEDWERTLGR